jgi:twitching motility protein PilT
VLERLVKATIKAGGHALKLMPGRRMVVVTPTGEWEVQGEVQTAAGIEKILAPVLPPGGRERLAQGAAEWEIDLPGIGTVQLVAAPVADGLKAMVSLAGAPGTAEEQAKEQESGRGAPIALGVEWSGSIQDLFRRMPDLGASDLHLSVGSPPMLRHDGEMRVLAGIDPLAASDIEGMLATLLPERNREEFDRRHDTDFAHEIPGVARFRCNVFRDRKGMGGVFRIIPTKILTAEEMGLSPEILQLCHLPKGLVLVTGPTGSGKSTTLAALVDYVNRNRTDHIITIEDPIEFVHENKRCLVNQRQVVEHTDSFRDALRAALREDPDIVLVGELRDLETAAIAIETAETGHLVFATLHTSSAPSTVDRLIDQFPADRQSQIRVMLSESLKGVISQTLCRKIGGGRVPAFEVLIVVPAIANLIREGKVFQIPSIMQTGKRYGMCQMNESLLDLVKRKVVDPQEACAKAVDKAGLVSMMRRAGIETPWLPPEPAQ